MSQTNISTFIIPAVISIGISLVSSAITRCRTRRQIQVLETQIQMLQTQQQRQQQYAAAQPPYAIPQPQQYMMPPPYAPGPQVMTI